MLLGPGINAARQKLNQPELLLLRLSYFNIMIPVTSRCTEILVVVSEPETDHHEAVQRRIK